MYLVNKSVCGALALTVLCMAAGCNGTEPLNTDARDKPPRERMPVSTDKHPVPIEIMDRLYTEVAEQSGYERGDIVLVRAQEAAWGDGSLGCPQPNVAYTQMIVSGYWVILRAGREEYDYRIDHNRRHHRCTGATKQPPIVYPSET